MSGQQAGWQAAATAADMECIVDEEQLRLYVFSLSLSLLLSLFLRCASSAKLKNRYAKAVGWWGEVVAMGQLV